MDEGEKTKISRGRELVRLNAFWRLGSTPFGAFWRLRTMRRDTAYAAPLHWTLCGLSRTTARLQMCVLDKKTKTYTARAIVTVRYKSIHPPVKYDIGRRDALKSNSHISFIST
jgi:hypothetical protein